MQQVPKTNWNRSTTTKFFDNLYRKGMNSLYDHLIDGIEH